MKTVTRLLFLTVLGAFAIGAAAPRAAAHSSVSFDFFYDSLDPYGEWIETGDSGYVWHPRDVDDDWAPYTDGYWAYTDAGWTWVSYEDYGNITYHYGRWSHLHDVGWCWTPDYEWAPAWVSWRSSNDYVGWAPLPPEARFHAGISFGGGVDVEFGIGPGYYNFVGVRDFGSPALRPVIIDRSRNVTIIDNSRNVTNITYNDNRVYNGGPNFATVSKLSAKPIQRLKLVQQRDAALAVGKKGFAKKVGNQLIMPAPVVSAPTTGVKPKNVARTVAQANVDKGWSGVTDPAVKEKLQKKMQAEAKAPKGQVQAQTAAADGPTLATEPAVVQPGKNGKRGKPQVAAEGTTAVGQGKRQAQGKNAKLKPFEATAPTANQPVADNNVAEPVTPVKKNAAAKARNEAAINARAKQNRNAELQAQSGNNHEAAIAAARNKQQRGEEMRSQRANEELALQRQRQAQQAEARQQQQQAQQLRRPQAERPPQAQPERRVQQQIQPQQRRAPQQVQPQRRVQPAPQPKPQGKPQPQPEEKKKNPQQQEG